MRCIRVSGRQITDTPFFFLLTFFHCSLRVLLLLFKNDRERELFIFNFFSIYCYKTVYRTYFLNLYRVKKAIKYTPSNSDPLRVTIQLFGKSLVTLIFLSRSCFAALACARACRWRC